MRDYVSSRLCPRKRELRRVVPRRTDRVRYLDHVLARGMDLFRTCCEQDLEGIVAKQRDGIYDPEATTWLKVKNRGYSQARDRSELFEGRVVGGRR